jgi:hypothetical protein
MGQLSMQTWGANGSVWMQSNTLYHYSWLDAPENETIEA